MPSYDKKQTITLSQIMLWDEGLYYFAVCRVWHTVCLFALGDQDYPPRQYVGWWYTWREKRLLEGFGKGQVHSEIHGPGGCLVNWLFRDIKRLFHVV